MASQAYAGAWTQPKGQGQVIVSGLYYSTDALYNNQGNKQSQANYRKYEMNPYLEYGWLENVTVGANLMLQRAHQDGTMGSAAQTNWGIGDSEFFIRSKLWEKDGLVFSAEPMIKLPSPEPGDELPQLGGRHPDAGLGFSAGYGFSTNGRNHFANLDAQYRYRFGRPENQIKLAATLGVSLTEKWMILPQAFITRRAATPDTTTFTQSSGDDYNLTKLQLSAVYKLTDDIMLQGGGFIHAGGRNVGAGNGVLFSVWKKF
jgi:protein XagA